jgi:hypothetical protein
MSDVYCPHCQDITADAADEEIERLRARVEELEADQIPLDARLSLSCVIQNGVASDFLLAVNGEPTDQSISLPEACHIITDSQIDAAWAVGEDVEEADRICGVEVRGVVNAALAELGIERCENPDCVGGCANHPDWKDWVCPDCDGKGWVKR